MEGQVYIENLIRVYNLYKYRMSIVDFINLGSYILGLNQDGYLLVWNISSKILAQKNIKQFPFVGSDFVYKILQSKAVAILKNESHIFICGQNEIKALKVTDVENFIKKYKSNQIKYDLPSKHLREQQGIQTAILISLPEENQQMIDEGKENNEHVNLPEQQFGEDKDSVVYTTKTGKICWVNRDFSSSTVICDINSRDNHHGHNIGWQQSATCLLPYRDNNLLLVGTSAGRILIVNLVLKKVMEDIVSKNSLKLTAVSNLKLSSGEHRFYSLHENCVAQWSMQLQKCLGYYSYYGPYSFLYTEKVSLDCSKILISGGTSTIEVVSPDDHQNRSQIQTNLDSVHIMKQIGSRVFCGGPKGMIQILQMGITYLILFKTQPNLFF